MLAFDQFTSVLFALFIRELKTRFGDRRFGALWVIVEPSLHLIVILMVFSFIRSHTATQTPFELFLVVGILPFFLFRKIVTGLMSSIDQNKALFAYRPVKPIDTYISRLILETLIYSSIFLLILFVFGFFMGLDIVVYHPLMFLGVFSLLLLMGFALGIVASLIVSFFPTAKIIINALMLPLYFLSGVIFPVSIIPAQYLEYLLYNPVLHLIELLRESYFAHYPLIYGISLSYPFIVTLFVLFIGLYFYRYRRLALAARA